LAEVRVAWFVGQSALMIGAAFVLGLIVGWLAWGLGRRTATDGPASGPRVPLPPAPVMKLPPADIAATEPAEDLERIEGIGPQMARALADAGIRTYAQLAAADEATLRRAIDARGLRFAPSMGTWARQAQLLADGDEEGFADLTRRLVAGRDEGRE
jgi:predicted flap endonuclease-1-like 5' DNA nuclease